MGTLKAELGEALDSLQLESSSVDDSGLLADPAMMALLPAALKVVVDKEIGAAIGPTAAPTAAPTVAAAHTAANGLDGRPVNTFDDIIGGIIAAESLKVNTQHVQDQATGNVVTTATSAPKISLVAGVLMALCLVAAVSLVAVLRRARVSGFGMEGVRSMVGYSNSGSSPQLHTWNTRNPEGRVESTPATEGAAEGGCLMVGAAVGQGSGGGGSSSSSRTQRQRTGRKWGWGAEAGPAEDPIVQQAAMAVL
jgi:hypothetical protein